MSIIPKNIYGTRVDASDPTMPDGKAINLIDNVKGTGTPIEELWVNDEWGFGQAIHKEAGTEPNGIPDNADASQKLDGLRKISENDIINDLSQTYTFGTLEDALNSDIQFPLGKTLNIKERTTGSGGGAIWDVVLASSVTINGFDIVQSNGVPELALTLRLQPSMHAASFGVLTTNTTNDSAMQALINRINNGAGVNRIAFSSGTYNFQCFDELTRGRAAFEIRSLSNVDFVGGVATVFKAVTGGFGTDPFAILRIDKNSKNITIKGIEFYGDYSNVPEFQGQLANRSSGILIATWDLFDPTQASHDDFSINNIIITGCIFTNIGGAVGSQRKSNNTYRASYSTVEVSHCTLVDAQQANNSIGGDFCYNWKVHRNKLSTTIPLSDTIFTLGIDISRGSVGCEVSYNTVDKYHFGMKLEYYLEGGIGGTDIELNQLSVAHHNILTDIGHPTIDVVPGVLGSGTYGLRMSGTNLLEHDNQIAGLYNPANVGSEIRLITGIWSNFKDIEGLKQNLVRGQVTNAKNAVIHGSVSARNEMVCEFKKIRDCEQGIVLQAGGSALNNDIRRIKGPGIAMQICDQTFAKNNYIAETMQNGGTGAAIYGEQNGSDPTYRYWEVLDNEIIEVEGGAGVGVIMSGGINYAKEYRYRGGRMLNVAVRENFELVSDIIDDLSVKAKGVVNPVSLTVLNSKNVSSITNVDASTVQINFKKPMPNVSFTFDAKNQNDNTIHWIGYGATTTYLRLRSVDATGANLPLASSLMFTVV